MIIIENIKHILNYFNVNIIFYFPNMHT